MKHLSTQLFALIIALLSVFFSGIVITLGLYYDFEQKVIFIIASLLLLFIIIYVPGFYIMNNFIYQKIRPIYETLSSKRPPKQTIYKNIEDDKIVQEVNKEVQNWADQQSREIRELKANARYRKEFLGNVSHELKTPIFNLQGYILTLLDGGLEDPEINVTYLQFAEKNINRLISIVDDLSTITGLESGELDLVYSNFDIFKLIEEVYEMQEIMAQNYGISLLAPGHDKGPVKVYADKQRIFQLITNLVVNAIKYSKKDGTVWIYVYPHRNQVEIQVKDNGIGIPREHMNRIFERFYRVDKSRSRELGGTGLGLSIVKHVIEAHETSISVESKVGDGTKFTFFLERSPK